MSLVHQMQPPYVRIAFLLIPECFIARLAFRLNINHSVNSNQVLLLSTIISELLITIAAFIKQIRMRVDALLVRSLLSQRVEYFRTEVAFEGAKLMTFGMLVQYASVNEPRVAVTANIIPVVDVHVFEERFEFVIRAVTYTTSEPFFVKFKWE